MSATEVALGKLRQARERLPGEERSPDLDHLLSCFELQDTAWTELQAAAGGPTLAPRMLWDTNGASRNPQLFRGLVHLLAGFVPARDIPLAAHISEESMTLLLDFALLVGAAHWPAAAACTPCAMTCLQARAWLRRSD